jgi:hypothetical protein
MKNFKSFLTENYDHFEFWPIQDAYDWASNTGLVVVVVKKYNISSENITCENPVINGDVLDVDQLSIEQRMENLPRIGNTELRHLPCQFGTVHTSFMVSECNLGSLKGCPISVGARFSVKNNPQITSIDFLPRDAAQYILAGTGIKSFQGIEKQIEKINKPYMPGGNIIIPAGLESHCLGLLKIPSLKSIDISVADLNKHKPKTGITKMMHIINKHLVGDRDIIACQEELIEAGLKEFAKL